MCVVVVGGVCGVVCGGGVWGGGGWVGGRLGVGGWGGVTTVIQPRSTVIQGRSTVNHTEGSLHNPYWLIVGNNSTRHRPKH
ncbi:hypothetical protein PF006_g30599 [Phytophthora fragariae]|uniref:Uncharacterized protein n=1 Tax=Phytophthora fragariae TaxID=53985 RepID=A0A6A3PWS6_9STRA|nr:hypothetical protein PF006_g30599 [Phytophthora fragariae]